MANLMIERHKPSLFLDLLHRLTFRPWPQKRRVDVRDLNRYLRRDIGMDS